MALGANVGSRIAPLVNAPSVGVVTSEYKNPWTTIIDQGGLETQDAVAVLDPDAEITNATTHIFNTGGQGTVMHLRMKYDDGLTSITDPIVQVFGRATPNDQWQALFNSNSAPTLLSVIVTSGTDVTDGVDDYTAPGGIDGEVTFNLNGCSQILVGVTTVLAATGDPTLSTLQARVL